MINHWERMKLEIFIINDPIGLYASENIQLDVTANREFSLYYLLCQQMDFQSVYKEFYTGGFRTAVLEIAAKDVMKNAECLKDSAIMNALRWNVYEGITDVEKIERRYLRDNEWIRTFLQNRIEFLDEEWS